MRILFRIHAIQRMFERGVTADDVRFVLENGETIEDYPEDTPYPSRLMLGLIGTRHLHVVAAYNAEEHTTIIVTIYEPDARQWEPGFKRRKR